jgi:hypothetical protein
MIDVLGKPDTDPANAGEYMSVLNLLGHETQHGLQNMFQMPRGGSAGDPNMQMFFPQMQKQAENIRVQAETAREAFARDYAMQHGGGADAYTIGRNQWALTDPTAATILQQAEHVGGAPPRRAGPTIENATGRKAPVDYFGQYVSLAGEQQARNTQDRMLMSTEQRRAEPSFLTGPSNFQLSPALQMIKWNKRDFELPDMSWALANTQTGR